MKDVLPVLLLGLISILIGFGLGHLYNVTYDTDDINDSKYDQCIKTYKECDMNDILTDLSKSGGIIMSHYKGEWYIRFEFEVDDGIEYNFKSDDFLEPKYALYDLVHKINESGVKL